MREARFRSPAASIVSSTVLIAIGTIFFLDNLNLVHARSLLRYWPAILIVSGIAKLLDMRNSAGRVWGALIACLGAILLAGNLGWFHVSFHTLWPLALIAVGVLTLARALTAGSLFRSPWNPTSSQAAASSDTIHDIAIFSGVKRKVETHNFLGGDIVCLFGGVDLNMRSAVMPLGQGVAVLDIVATFGGVDLKVPAAWRVSVRGVAVFGAYEDKTAPPRPEAGVIAPELIITGHAVFGAVNIIN